MHKEPYDFVQEHFNNWLNTYQTDHISVLEIGSLDINGSVRPIFSGKVSSYLGIDMQEGPGVDLVADAAYFEMPDPVDIIVCCEVFEHASEWKKIIKNCYHNLSPRGILIATAAGEGRPPHSAIDEKPIRPWEHYANIGAWDLKRTLELCGFEYITVDSINHDVRCAAVKL